MARTPALELQIIRLMSARQVLHRELAAVIEMTTEGSTSACPTSAKVRLPHKVDATSTAPV